MTALWDRIGILRFAFRGQDRAAAQVARRWSDIARKDPRLPADVIRLGGVLAMQPQRIENGVPAPDPIDPVRLAYEAGRRDMTVELLSLMQISYFELSQMMETNDVAD